MKNHLPAREDQLLALQNTSEFDVLIIGGGATGSGCALDAVTRGEPWGHEYIYVGFFYYLNVCSLLLF